MRATAATEKLARVVAILASVWFALTALWGLLAIPGAGYLGAGSAAHVMAAEQMVRWHIVLPALGWYDGQPPAPAAYVCDHPFGQYWMAAAFLAVFGHHDLVVRLPAALMSAAIPPLLYGIARERWGVVAGAVAASAYVVLPITLGFSQLFGPEPLCITGALLFFWGHSRHMSSGKRRYAAVSLAGLGLACSGDWAGTLLVAPVLGWALVRAYVLPARFSPRLKLRPYARWWALSVAVAVGSLLLTLALFLKAGQLSDKITTLQQVGMVAGGAEGAKLRAVLDARRLSLELAFTPLAIALGKVAAVVCVVRWLLTRRDEETYAPSLLLGAGASYLLAKTGTEPPPSATMYFAAYFALAMAQLAHAIGLVAALVARRASRWDPAPVAAWVTLGVGLAPLLALAPDGARVLGTWRRTGGRYDDGAALTRSHVDMLSVLRQVVAPVTFPGTPIDAHPSARWGPEQLWTYRGVSQEAKTPLAGAPGAASHPFWIASASAMTSDEQRKLAGAAHVRIYGDTWLVDQREAVAPVDAYSLGESEPGPVQWLLFDPTELRREVSSAPDPWATWEWRAHLDQQAIAPTAEPVTLDQVRIAHNIAIARGDEAAATRLRERVLAGLDRSVTAAYDGGLSLLGVRVLGGVEPRVEAWFEVGTALTADLTFAVRSAVVRRARLSLLPVDTVEREMSWPEPLPTKLWKARYLYVTTAVLNHRVGVERYAGRWLAREGGAVPHRVDRAPETVLALLP